MTPEYVGGYRLDSLLGAGGMGEVYKAYDTQRDRYVALKLLPAEVSGDREYLSRFQRESYAVARLRDPHIIPIHDFGEIDNRLFIDMRLVDGTDIGALLQAGGPIAPQRAAHFVGQIAEALDAAHADRIVHRDIKPSNVLVTTSDFVYVIDFGITRAMGYRQTALTVTGATVGTMNYMAPERFTGQDIDGRSDVYSLACVLHECLTGAPPFSDKDLPALIYAHLYSTSPRASSLVAGVPPALDDVIARGMAKDPGERFATAGLLAAAVREALLTGAPDLPKPEPRDGGWGRIPASAWVSATEAWQNAGQPRQLEARAAEPVPGSLTQTMIADRSNGRGGIRPPENVPPGLSPAAFPGPVGAASSGSTREPAHRRRGAAILAALAVAAVAVVIIALAVNKPHTSNLFPAANTSTGTRTATGTTASAAPAVALPEVAKTLAAGQSPSFVKVAPNGKFAYVTDTAKQALTVLDTVTDRVSGTIKIPQGPPQSLSFSPDSRTAYVSVYNTRGSVHLVAFVDTATGQVTGVVTVGNHTPGPSAVSPDGRYLYVPNHNMSMMTDSGLSDIDVIDTASKKLVHHITVQPNPHWVVFGPNGLAYVTNHTSDMLTVIDSTDNRVIKTIVVGVTPHSMAISPDGSHLAITSYSGNQVFVVSTAAVKVVATIPVGRLPLDVTYSPDGRYIYTTNNEDDTISVIDTATDKLVGTINAGKAPTSISVLPNGRQAYVTDEGSGTVEVLNLPK